MKNTPADSMHDRVRTLSRKLWAAYMVFGAILLAQFSLFFAAPSHADCEIVDNSDKIIRTRGIIVVDEKGRDRVLIGAPVPQSENRVLTIKSKAMAAWKDRIPENHPYWDQFSELHTAGIGMIVLDENGFDRVAIGDRLPDANTGKRIGTATGITIHNEKGFERAGFGTIKTADGMRVGLGMDDEHGEALNLFVAKGFGAGLRINDSKNQLLFGTLEPKKMYNSSDQPFSGYMFRQGNEVKHQFNVLEKK